MGPGAGDIVLAAGPDVGDPPWPSIRRGHDLDVAAVAMVLARPPQIHRPAVDLVGPAALQRSVCTRVPSRCTWGWPAARAASSAPRRPGATAASTSMPSCR